MNCPVCGKLIKDEVIFCVHCGSKIPRCPTCGKAFDKPVRFCGNDGMPLPEEMFAVLKQKKNVSGFTEEQSRIRSAAQPRLDAAATSVSATVRKTENLVGTVSVPVPEKKRTKKSVAFVLIIILLLLMVGVGMVIGICFPDTLKDILPDSVVDMLIPDGDEKEEEKIDNIERLQEDADVEVISEDVNAASDEKKSESLPSVAETQEQESTEQEAAEGIVEEETEAVEDTSNEEETVEEELDRVLIFILNSDCYYFTEEDIADFSAEMCRLARNGIYAKMGRMFNDESLTDYFLQYDWYEPMIAASDFSESMLNDYQIANRDLIVAFETAQGYR